MKGIAPFVPRIKQGGCDQHPAEEVAQDDFIAKLPPSGKNARVDQNHKSEEKWQVKPEETYQRDPAGFDVFQDRHMAEQIEHGQACKNRHKKPFKADVKLGQENIDAYAHEQRTGEEASSRQ